MAGNVVQTNLDDPVSFLSWVDGVWKKEEARIRVLVDIKSGVGVEKAHLTIFNEEGDIRNENNIQHKEFYDNASDLGTNGHWDHHGHLQYYEDA